jgi:hypothetical protein
VGLGWIIQIAVRDCGCRRNLYRCRLLAAGSGYCIIYEHWSYYYLLSYAHNDEHAGKAGIAIRAYHMPLEVSWRCELIGDA